MNNTLGKDIEVHLEPAARRLISAAMSDPELADRDKALMIIAGLAASTAISTRRMADMAEAHYCMKQRIYQTWKSTIKAKKAKALAEGAGGGGGMESWKKKTVKYTPTTTPKLGD